MKVLYALIIIAVAFGLGFGSANKWIALHPKQEIVEEIIAEVVLPEPEIESIPEPIIEEIAPEPEVIMIPQAPIEQVAAPEPEVTIEVEPLPLLDLRSRDARLLETSPALEKALAMTLESSDWTASHTYLRTPLVTHFAKLEADEVRNLDATLEAALVRQILSQERFLSKVPESVIRPLFAADHTFATWLLANTKLLDIIYHNLNASDNPEMLLSFLSSLHQEMKETLITYENLAVACGLVHDSKDSKTKANQRFLWYVDMDQKGRLYRDIKSMPVSDLIYVVDGVDLGQLNWVHAKYRGDIPRSKAGKVYSQIKYRMDLVTGDVKRKELYPEYTLEAIAESGGICADQAHFAQNVCRSVGIPAIKIVGSGNRGAHAWVVYQDNDGTWDGVGRYENYATGTYRDPQVRKNTTESALTIRSTAPFRSAARVAKIRNRSLVADFLADSGDIIRGTEAAILIAESEREYLPAWERVFTLIEGQRERIIEASAARLPERNALTADRVVAIIKKFEIALKNEPDMLGRSDKVLTKTLDGILDEATLLEVLRRRRKRVETYDASRLDTILDLIKQEADILSRMEDFDAVTSLYRRELRSYGDDLQFFRKLASSFWKLSKEDPTRRNSALGLLNSEVKSNFEGLLEGNDYFGKEEAIRVYVQLRDYYHEAENSSKVNRLEKKIARAREELKETKI